MLVPLDDEVYLELDTRDDGAVPPDMTLPVMDCLRGNLKRCDVRRCCCCCLALDCPKTESTSKPGTEVHVLPPRRCEVGVEPSQRIPNGAPDEPAGRRRLIHRDRIGGRATKGGRPGETESEPGRRR